MYCFFWIICSVLFSNICYWIRKWKQNWKKNWIDQKRLPFTHKWWIENKTGFRHFAFMRPNHNSLLKALLFLNLKFFFHYLIPTSRLQIGQGSGERRRGLFGRTYKVKKTLTPECYISLQSNVTPTPTICELMPEQLILNAQCICIFNISIGK